MGPSGRIGYILHILDCLGQDMQVLYLGRAPRTKETLPDFLKWRRVTRPPLVFRGLSGSQRTPGFWGVTPPHMRVSELVENFAKHIHDLHVEIRRKISLSNEEYKLAADVHRRSKKFRPRLVHENFQLCLKFRI